MNHLTVDKVQCVDINYLDCEKAFNRFLHQRLHTKLEAIDIGGKVLHWITNFLTNRYHRVNIKKSASNWLPVMSGVPQGSVLGPVLFLNYINDTDNNLESVASLFADDAKIYKIIKTKEDIEALQRDLKQLDNWSDKWLLSFNMDKCNTMHVGHNTQQAEYHLKGAMLNKSSQEKHLSITVSNNLKSSAHVETITAKAISRVTITAKAISRVEIIKRNFSVLSKEILVPLYLSLVHPILDYGAESWSPNLIQDIQSLERIQRRATKLVPECAQLSYEEKCQHLDLHTLQDRKMR